MSEHITNSLDKQVNKAIVFSFKNRDEQAKRAVIQAIKLFLDNLHGRD